LWLDFFADFFLIIKIIKDRDLIKKIDKFNSLVWTEFETQFQVLGPSFKLGPKFFFRFDLFVQIFYYLVIVYLIISFHYIIYLVIHKF
jgi:hypothetical protein